jgi:hypothetical protein
MYLYVHDISHYIINHLYTRQYRPLVTPLLGINVMITIFRQFLAKKCLSLEMHYYNNVFQRSMLSKNDTFCLFWGDGGGISILKNHNFSP